MTGVSISFSRGASGVMSDFTIGTSTPGTGEFELRYLTTDSQSNNITMLDLHLFLEKLKFALIESNLGQPLVANNSTPFITEPQI